jgi:hypothetical protein
MSEGGGALLRGPALRGVGPPYEVKARSTGCRPALRDPGNCATRRANEDPVPVRLRSHSRRAHARQKLSPLSWRGQPDDLSAALCGAGLYQCPKLRPHGAMDVPDETEHPDRHPPVRASGRSIVPPEKRLQLPLCHPPQMHLERKINPDDGVGQLEAPAHRVGRSPSVDDPSRLE